MKVDGRCHCGRIAYEAEVDPERVHICHYSDCQALFGSAFRIVARTPVASFRLLSGQPKNYVKRADSGNEMIQSFCPDCGSPIFGAHTDNPAFYGIRVAALRQRDRLPPKLQIWCRSELPWVDDTNSLPRVEKHA
jgi:hypothetical protein